MAHVVELVRESLLYFYFGIIFGLRMYSVFTIGLGIYIIKSIYLFIKKLTLKSV